MAQSSIPVDVTNPGQVFACLGIVEATLQLVGEPTRAAFDWRDPVSTRFVVDAPGDEEPVPKVLEFIANASVRARAPRASTNSTMKWDIPTDLLTEDVFPFPDPPSPATLPVSLSGKVAIDHWGDISRDDPVKFWGGAGGFPAAALARDAIALVRDRWREAISDPLNFSAPQSSSFRFDWRRDYIPIDAGFSLNSHSGERFSTMGYPFVELLASIGLTYARPHRRHKVEYVYGVVGTTERGLIELLPASVLRTALGSDELPFCQRRFRMRLGWPGKEGQARAITIVTEENR